MCLTRGLEGIGQVCRRQNSAGLVSYKPKLAIEDAAVGTEGKHGSMCGKKL